MTDFASLIERAIERDLRGRFLAFLSTYHLVEFGRARTMTLDEQAMVISCLDGFLVEASLLDLGVAEIRDLRGRLFQLTQPKLESVVEFAIANTCFDALACIAALEARLCCCLDRADIRRLQCSARFATVANDS